MATERDVEHGVGVSPKPKKQDGALDIQDYNDELMDGEVEDENMKMAEMIKTLQTQLYPSGKFWVNFGHVLLKTGRPVSAFQAFKKALKMGKINMSFIAGFLKSIYYTLILRKKEN